MNYVASYSKLNETGKLKKRAEQALNLLARCRLCPRRCGVNRLKGERGFCGIGFLPKVASITSHFGEEPPISGSRGSGTVFFSGCNMRCVFCQNYPISQLRHGREMTLEGLARAMVRIKKMGCHNLNLVTPSHVVPQILAALALAVEQGFDLPIVYNSSGYDSVATLGLLDGVVDIFLPDMKYAHEDMAKRYSGAADYCRVNRDAILEMHRQVGELKLDDRGIAHRGLIIRHLVLPQGMAGTAGVLDFIAKKVSRQTHVSLMGQYFPANGASRFPELNRRITTQEYDSALNIMEKLKLVNGWFQQEEYAQAQGY